MSDWLEDLIEKGVYDYDEQYKDAEGFIDPTESDYWLKLYPFLASAIRAEIEKRLDGLNALDDNGYLMALKDIRKALGLEGK